MSWRTFFIILLCAPLGRGVAQAPAPRTLELRGGWWLTDSGFVRRQLYLVDGHFAARRPAVVDSILELGDSFIVPPYGDAHTHRFTDPATVTADVAEHVRGGVFYVFSLTGSASGRRELAGSVNGRTSIDVAYAETLTSTRGHPTLSAEVAANRIPWDSLRAYWPRLLKSRKAEGDVYFLIDSLGDVRRKWERVLANEPDLIKIYLMDVEHLARQRADTTSIGQRGLDPSLVPAIVTRAHAAGLRVAAHVETAADFRVAVAAGVDVIAHLPGLSPRADEDPARYLITRADAAMAKRSGTTVIATAWLAERLAAAKPWLTGAAAAPDTAQLQRARRIQRTSLAELKRAGVQVAIGSDLFGDAVTEALYLNGLGVFGTNESLAMLTRTTPQLMFPKRRIGKLEPGYEGSFLSLGCDPSKRLECIREIGLRIKQGMILRPAQN